MPKSPLTRALARWDFSIGPDCKVTADHLQWIRFDRAGGRCECRGECGHDHGGRCDAYHGKPHPITGSTVILTVAHRDHTPENCGDDNLFAGCQRCHLKYDAEHHAENARKARRSKLAAGDFFDKEGAA